MRTGNYILYTVFITDNKYSESSKKLLYSPIASMHGYTIINPKITMEINKVGSFEFTLPRTNPEFENVKSMETCVIVEQNYEDDYQQTAKEVWRGRVISRELDFYSNAEIICEGFLGSLQDHMIIGGMKALTNPKLYETGMSLWQVMFRLCTFYSGSSGGFGWTFTTNPGREVRFQPSGKILGNQSHPVNSNEGAYKVQQFEETDDISCLEALNILTEKYPIFLRKNDPFYAQYGTIEPLTMYVSAIDDHEYISDQTIEFGSNLIDLSEMLDFSSLYTVMWAFGQTKKDGVRVTLGGQIGYSDDTYEIPDKLIPAIEVNATGNLNNENYGALVHKELLKTYGYIERSVEFPEVPLSKELLEKSLAKFNRDIAYSVQISLKAIDLSLMNVNYAEFEIGDFVRVISAPHGINTNTICSRIVLDLGTPSNNEYTFGLNFKSLTARQASIDKQNSQLYEAAKNSVYQEKE